ncbi:MAG: BamA/TamA family outer membrane protein [Bacteroidetes bacterium]|nr:BamA/TamA family outer membrane protein [Bacteroidota bacterium]
MRLVSNYNKSASTIITILMIVMLSACSEQRRTTVVNYPINKAFVYNNKIEISGTGSKDEKKQLTTELDNYWDDSIRIKRMQKFGFFYKIKQPAVYNPINVQRSISFMNAYLQTKGFYRASFADSVRVDTVGDQLQTNIILHIETGSKTLINNVAYAIADSTLQQLTNQHRKQSLLVTGNTYTKESISQDLDRLTSLYRNNGYFGFNKENLVAEVDTTDTKLLELVTNPFLQIARIDSIEAKQKRSANWDIVVKNKKVLDSIQTTPFTIRSVHYYPEVSIYESPDTLMGNKFLQNSVTNKISFHNKVGKFSSKPLLQHNYLMPGTLYNEGLYYKTLNTLGQIGAWQQVDANIVRAGKDSLDIHVFLVPATKQSASIDLEGSRNSADIVTGNTLGISTNLNYTNRNVWKQAIQSVTSFRTGVELNLIGATNNNVVQTFLMNAGHTYSIPHIIQPFKNWKKVKLLDNQRTLVSLNGSYVDRKDYYQLKSLVSSIGYEWHQQKKNGDNIWLYKPLNLELYSINRLAGLDTLIKNNPFLQASFNEGNIFSQSFSFIRTVNSTKHANRSHFFRVSAEEAGGILAFLPSIKNNVYRYIKTETEYRQLNRFNKSALAFRAFAGFGYNYGSDPIIGKSLPFFKQFIAGGPYSMRAWGLRQLGLGSSVFSDTVNSTYRDRFGDMQLETNIEYRFTVADFESVKIGGAVFADIGNIWNVKKNATEPDAQFTLKNFGKDLAVGIGTGLRFDFSYFLLRFDLAYRVKDPARQQNNGWMSFNNFAITETRASGLKVNNLALQFGIGLPF